MDNDDKPVGRILNRREVLALLGAAGMVAVAGRFPAQALAQAAGGTATRGAGAAVPACVVRPEPMEGPYFTDERLRRSDTRVEPMTGEVKEGIPLALTFRVFQIGDGCTPLPGATVDIWSCDAQGDYSAFVDTTQGFDTVGQSWPRPGGKSASNRSALHPGSITKPICQAGSDAARSASRGFFWKAAWSSRPAA